MEKVLINSERWLSIEDFEDEKWKEITGTDIVYYISNYGRVKSYQHYSNLHNGGKRFYPTKIMKNNTAGRYQQVTLRTNGKDKPYAIHRLVANYFIANPLGLPMINHKNEDKSDNRANNLEWCDAKYNTCYGKARERAFKTYKKNHPVTLCQYSKEGFLLHEFSSLKEAGQCTGCNPNNIRAVCKGKYISSMGFIWRYKDDPFDKYPTSRKSKAKVIIQYTKNGTFIKKHPRGIPGIIKSGEFGNASSIQPCANGITQSAYGYVWRYEGDPFQYKRGNYKNSQSIEILDSNKAFIERLPCISDGFGKYFSHTTFYKTQNINGYKHIGKYFIKLL